MPVKIKEDGSFEVLYAGPYKGVNVQAPPNLIDDAEAVTIQNFLVRNSQIQSRPQFIPWTSPALPGPAVLTGQGTFLSPLGFYHTFATDSAGNLYNLTAATNTLTNIAALPTLQSLNPIQWRVFNGILYYVNGSQSVGAWDGQLAAGGIIRFGVGAGGAGYAVGDTGTVTTGAGNAKYQVTAVVAGAVSAFILTNTGSGYSTGNGQATAIGGTQPGAGNGAFTVNVFLIGTGPRQQVVKVDGGATVVGAKYIGVLDQHVLLANTVGNASDGPFTIRWSAIALPEQFDPTVNINAGFNIFIDFADAISGLMLLGRVGYLFHRTGITEIAPTGVGTAPFDFNHVWNAQDGSGNIFANTVAQYGQVGAFVSTEDIYSIQNYQFSAIGGNARDAIMADFALGLTQIGSPAPVATIVPGYENDFIYLTYQIIIPLSNMGPTVIWQYSFAAQTWERLVLTGAYVTGIPTFCLTK